MAYFRAAIGGGGGGLVRTTLWTNPDPTVQFCPDSSTHVNITLSDDIDNYQFLEFIFQKTTTNTDSFSMMVPVTDFKLTQSGAGTGRVKYVANVSAQAYMSIFRTFCYEDDTTVRMERCLLYRANNPSTASNNYAIPLYVKGVNAN